MQLAGTHAILFAVVQLLTAVSHGSVLAAVMSDGASKLRAAKAALVSLSPCSCTFQLHAVRIHTVLSGQLPDINSLQLSVATRLTSAIVTQFVPVNVHSMQHTHSGSHLCLDALPI